MKRSAAIITATIAFAFTGCSTIRQYDLAPDGNESTPTTEYVVDIGTAVVPAEVADPCTAGLGPCAPTTTTQPVPSNDPPCDTSGFPSPCQVPVTVPSGPATGVCTDGLVHAEEGGCN